MRFEKEWQKLAIADYKIGPVECSTSRAKKKSDVWPFLFMLDGASPRS